MKISPKNLQWDEGYEVSELAEDLIHFADLLLVLQVNRGVEVRNFVFFSYTLTNDVVFTGMHELSQRFGKQTHTLITVGLWGTVKFVKPF